MSETRKKLLEATGRVLATKGYAGLTTKRVATEADVSHPAVHYHFDTKDALIVAFIKDYTDQWLTLLEDIKSDAPSDRLRHVLEIFYEGLRDPEQGALTRAMIELHTRAPHSEPLESALTNLEQETIKYLREVIASGIENGDFNDVNPETMARLILCAVDGITLRQHTLEEDATAVFTDGLTEHVLTDLYRDEPPTLGDI